MLGYGCVTFYLKKHLTKSLEFRKAIDIFIITYHHTVRRKDGLTLKVRAIDKTHLCLRYFTKGLGSGTHIVLVLKSHCQHAPHLLALPDYLPDHALCKNLIHLEGLRPIPAEA